MRWLGVRWGAVLGSVALAEVLLVAAAVLYMVIYGNVFNPGHPQGFYDRHVRLAGPWISIAAGMPLFFFLARSLVQGGSAIRNAVALWAMWAVADTAILIAADGFGGIGRILPLWAASHLTKIAAIWAAVRFQERPNSR
jgi:hypothetical protein